MGLQGKEGSALAVAVVTEQRLELARSMQTGLQSGGMTSS
jgi:hypothetical protein